MKERPSMGLWRVAVLVSVLAGFWSFVIASLARPVIPAEAGIQSFRGTWVPVFTGTTKNAGTTNRACVLHELTPRQAAVVSQWAHEARAGDYVIARECFRPKEVAR